MKEVLINLVQTVLLVIGYFTTVYMTVYIGTRAWCRARSKTVFTSNTTLNVVPGEKEAVPPQHEEKRKDDERKVYWKDLAAPPQPEKERVFPDTGKKSVKDQG